MNITELKTIFDFFDKDHSGTLNPSEFPDAVRALGLNPTSKELVEILREADKDNDGVINFEEFQQLYSFVKIGQDHDKEDVAGILDSLNFSSGGVISVDELKNILSGEGEPLTDREIRKIIREFDKNKLGMINLQELVNTMMGHEYLIQDRDP